MEHEAKTYGLRLALRVTYLLAYMGFPESVAVRVGMCFAVKRFRINGYTMWHWCGSSRDDQEIER